MRMKKTKAAKLQYKVFRKVFSRSTRKHRRRVFLTEALEKLQSLCGYSPQQVNDITHRIAKDLTFNLFMGVKIYDFGKYCKGFQGSKNQQIDRIEITLLPASLSILEFFKRDEEYKVKYYSGDELILTTTEYARRF